MNSIRERILREVVTRIAAAIAPCPLLRQPTAPVPRETSPAVLLFAESDRVDMHVNDLVERSLQLRLVVLSRGEASFDQADQLLVAAHAALLADPNLGGLALGISEVDCDWEAEEADAGAVALPARYEIRYRTYAHDLTRA